MRWIALVLALLISGSASAQVGQIVWPPTTNPSAGGGGGGSCASASNTEVQTWGTNVDGQGGAVSPTQCACVNTAVSSLKTAAGTPLSSNVSRLWLATSADTTAGDIAAQFKVDVIHGSLLDFTNANIAARLSRTTGYTPNGTSEYIITPFNPSSSDTSVYGTNSATLGAYILSSGAGVAFATAVGAYDGSAADQLFPTTNATSNYSVASIHDTLGTSVLGPTTVFGLHLPSRISASTNVVRQYQGSSAFTATNSAAAVVSVTNRVLYIAARNNAGTADGFENDSIGAIILARGLDTGGGSTESNAVAAAMNTLNICTGAAHW